MFKMCQCEIHGVMTDTRLSAYVLQLLNEKKKKKIKFQK